jgi:hypothetical protein
MAASTSSSSLGCGSKIVKRVKTLTGPVVDNGADVAGKSFPPTCFSGFAKMALPGYGKGQGFEGLRQLNQTGGDVVGGAIGEIPERASNVAELHA